MQPADLDPVRIGQALRTRRLGRSLDVRASTDSTNDDARAAASAGAPDGHVVLADTQTRGRGSRGRSWHSPAGSDLYLSIVVRTELPVQQLSPLTLAVGLGVAEAAEAFLPGGTSPAIKWPNDVWIGRSKLAGILVECASLGQSSLPVIVGIGVNVNRAELPAKLDTPATSLRLVRGEPVDRVRVLAELLGRVEHWLDRFLDGDVQDVVQALDARLCLRGERARCDEIEGVVLGVATSGSLRMLVDGQERELFAGTLRPQP